MPKKLQIYTFKRIFKAYNKNSDRMDEIDFELIDSEAELLENRELLKNNYPQFCWSENDLDVGGVIIDRRKKEHDLEEHGEDRRFTKYVTIKPHRIRSKGKVYERGRIQISINPKFIGYKARVEVEIYVPEEKEEPIPEDLEKALDGICMQDEEYWAQRDENKEQKEI